MKHNKWQLHDKMSAAMKQMQTLQQFPVLQLSAEKLPLHVALVM